MEGLVEWGFEWRLETAEWTECGHGTEVLTKTVTTIKFTGALPSLLSFVAAVIR